MVWIMEVKVDGEWRAVHGNGPRYEYATEGEARNMLRICYPDQLREQRLGGEETVRVREMPERKFKLVTTDTNDDVLGGTVAIGNAYISAYGSLVSGKQPDELDVGESCLKRYALSGQKPTVYKIVRVE